MNNLDDRFWAIWSEVTKRTAVPENLRALGLESYQIEQIMRSKRNTK
jgi:hypothetical protein